MAVHALKSNMRRAQSYTWATLPAVGLAGRQAWCTNFGTKGALLIDDGTRWKPTGVVTLASLDTTPVSGTNNTEGIALQYLMPATMWTLKDHVRVFATITKDGAVDSGTLRIRIGTAGTVADTSVYGSNILSAANLNGGIYTDFRLDTATTVQHLGTNAATNPGYSISGNIALNGPVTISSAVANALFISVTLKSTGATNLINATDITLQYSPGGN